MQVWTWKPGTKEERDYPLYEAEYPLTVNLFRVTALSRDTKIGDHYNCLISKDLLRIPGIVGSYIGADRTAIVVFKGTDGRPDHARRFRLSVSAGRARDKFDESKDVKTQPVTLYAPTQSMTMKARREALARRRAATPRASRPEKAVRSADSRHIGARPRPVIKTVKSYVLAA